MDYKLVPDHKGLLLMNRILTTHFFEYQICKEYKYPTLQQKQELAKRILQEFPQLQSLRVCDDSLPEVCIYWQKVVKSDNYILTLNRLKSRKHSIELKLKNPYGARVSVSFLK